MVPIETTAAFFAASALLALSPGPDNLFVLVHSALHGRSAGLCVVLGLCTGLVGHTVLVAAGLAALFAASAIAYTALKFAGAAYLLYLAWHAFRAPAGGAGDERAAAMTRPELYRRGVIMNLTNPKVAIFFLAFLPQFTSPASGPVGPQVLWLGFVFILAALLVFGAIAWFAGSVGALLRRSTRVRQVLNWTAGAVFVALALRLVAADA